MDLVVTVEPSRVCGGQWSSGTKTFVTPNTSQSKVNAALLYDFFFSASAFLFLPHTCRTFKDTSIIHTISISSR
jgi:hypothetical protein